MFVYNTREKHFRFVPEEAGLKGGGKGATASAAVGLPTFQSSARRFVLGNGLDSANREEPQPNKARRRFFVERASSARPPLHHVTIRLLDAMVRRGCG